MQNWAIPEVRGYKFAFIEELCENYDLDGFELDFLRIYSFFQLDKTTGRQRREIITALRPPGARVVRPHRPRRPAAVALRPGALLPRGVRSAGTGPAGAIRGRTGHGQRLRQLLHRAAVGLRRHSADGAEGRGVSGNVPHDLERPESARVTMLIPFAAPRRNSITPRPTWPMRGAATA